MSRPSPHLIVVGQGAAGLAAALTAAQEACGRAQPLRVTLIDKADPLQAGGNTRWSPSNMRMAAADRVEPGFVHDMLAATEFRGEESYFRRLAADAPAMVAWIASQGIAFSQPPYYLAKGPPRIQPVGGGAALVDALTRAAKGAGIETCYACTAEELVVRDGGIAGVIVSAGPIRESIAADAVVLACGGFQGDKGMMREHLGPGAQTMRLISPGTHFNTGDGIRMGNVQASKRIAPATGNGMHAEPVDARDPKSAPVVLVYPYGIVVDRSGRRFFDEGAGLVHETWERFARKIHFNTAGATAYAILDSRLLQIPDYRRAIRSEMPPVEADDIPGLARLLGADADNLARTIAGYNAACTGERRKNLTLPAATVFAAARITDPPKSNWARAIKHPAVPSPGPLVGAAAYTFGGLTTDDRARVLRAGAPIPGLYAAGEITGHFHATAPNSVSVLRAFVFGRIAGREAVVYCGRAHTTLPPPSR